MLHSVSGTLFGAKINKKHETRKRFRTFYMFLDTIYEKATFLHQANPADSDASRILRFLIQKHIHGFL